MPTPSPPSAVPPIGPSRAPEAPSRARPAAGPGRAPAPLLTPSNRERLEALGLCGGVDPFDTPQWEAGGAFDALHRGL